MKIEVRFTVTVPDSVSQEQAEEWLMYQLGAYGGMSSANPLEDCDLQADDVNFY